MPLIYLTFSFVYVKKENGQKWYRNTPIHNRSMISFSASPPATFIAYDLFCRDAFSHVQERRFCINPNVGFVHQLQASRLFTHRAKSLIFWLNKLIFKRLGYVCTYDCCMMIQHPPLDAYNEESSKTYGCEQNCRRSYACVLKLFLFQKWE